MRAWKESYAALVRWIEEGGRTPHEYFTELGGMGGLVGGRVTANRTHGGGVALPDVDQYCVAEWIAAGRAGVEMHRDALGSLAPGILWSSEMAALEAVACGDLMGAVWSPAPQALGGQWIVYLRPSREPMMTLGMSTAQGLGIVDERGAIQGAIIKRGGLM